MPKKSRIILNSIVVLLVLIVCCSNELYALEQDQQRLWTAQQSIDYALQNNPDSRIAAIRIDAARARIDKARSSLYPHLDFTTEYGQTDNAMGSFGNILQQGNFDSSINFNEPGTTDNLSLQAELRYRLYSGGKKDASVSRARFSRKRLSHDYVATINRLEFEVVRVFYQIILAEETIAARRSALQAIKASLHVARARLEAGDLLRQHLLDLEVQHARASEDLIEARHALRLLQHGFNNLLGIPEGPVHIDTKGSPAQKVPQKQDISSRSELKSIDKSIAAAQQSLIVARSYKLPKIDGFARYQYDRGFIDNGDGGSWMTGVALRLPLADGGLTSAKTQEAKAAIRELKEKRRKTKLLLGLELQQARQDLQQAKQSMAVTVKMVQLAQESARLSRARFKEGLVLSSDLIETERRLTDALLRNSQAKSRHRIAIANLRKTIGLHQF